MYRLTHIGLKYVLSVAHACCAFLSVTLNSLRGSLLFLLREPLLVGQSGRHSGGSVVKLRSLLQLKEVRLWRTDY